MGEIQEIFPDNLIEVLPVGLNSESGGNQSFTIIGEKIYAIGGSDNEENPSMDVQIFDKLTGKWEFPITLGAKPTLNNGHSSMPLNKDRILILKRNSTPDECAWFLEVDTPFVREQKKLLGTGVVAWSKGVRGDSPKPVVISGPSGVGKGTLIAELMKEFPSTFGFSVSHTTRAPREKEKNGVHYHFTERTVMEEEIQDGKFLEYASVHGNLYGTSIEAVEVVTDAGKSCILDIDVQGARSVRNSSLEAILIFICPPSLEELEKRLRARGTETEEQIQKRLRNAKIELEQGQSSGLFDHILVNDNFNVCHESLKKILGLDEKMEATSVTYQNSFELPMGNLESDSNKVLIHCKSAELEKASNKLFVLDLSSIKGGAPGRTRGLRMYAIDPFTNRVDRTEEQLQKPEN